MMGWDDVLLSLGGAAIPPLIGKMFGSSRPEQQQQIPRFSPGQMQTQNQLRSYAGNQLMGNQFDFGPIEAEARKGYQTKTIPTIMQRFASNDMLGSSALNSALSGSAKDLEMGLASLKQQYGLERQGLLQNLLGMGMAPQNDTIMRPEQPSDFQQLMNLLGQQFGQIGGSYLQGKYQQPDYWKQPQKPGVPASQVVGPYSEYQL